MAADSSTMSSIRTARRSFSKFLGPISSRDSAHEGSSPGVAERENRFLEQVSTWNASLLNACGAYRHSGIRKSA